MDKFDRKFFNPGKTCRAGGRIGQAAFADGGYIRVIGNAVTNRYGIPITT
ncbi:MAG: hypothetical protein IJQ81_09900 [Oscillibacter sp.]|nr:hypothetical protein [Oscillibacter sp.]